MDRIGDIKFSPGFLNQIELNKENKKLKIKIFIILFVTNAALKKLINKESRKYITQKKITRPL